MVIFRGYVILPEGRHVLRCWSPDSACNFSWPSSGKTSDAGRKKLAQQHCAGGDVFDQRGSVNFGEFFINVYIYICIYIYIWIIPYIMENKIHVWNHQPVLYIYIILSGWWYTYPSEKYESQIGSSSQLLGKIKVMFQSANQLWIFHITQILGILCDIIFKYLKVMWKKSPK